MKKKNLFLLVLGASTIFNCVSCNQKLTEYNISDLTYGSWQLQRDSQNDGYYWDLFFIDQENGWATLGGGKIIHTSDGGKNWIYQQTPLKNLVYSVSFINKNEGWACGENKIIHTTNGGINWNIIYTDTEKSRFGLTNTSFKYYQLVCFRDKLNGWATNESGELKHTSDGGFTWEIQAEWQFGGIADICFVNQSNGFILNPDNELLVTSDGGNNWKKRQVSGINFTNKMTFMDEYSGWIITQTLISNTLQNGCPIYKTTDSGNNWILKITLDDDLLTSVTFVNTNVGWITGRNGIYQTIDGGRTWKTDSSLVDKSFFQKVFAVDKQNVLALDFSGRIFKYIPN